MAAPTQREQLIAGLEGMDLKRVEDAHTRRYVVFRTASGEHYYVGKSGALRHGATIKSSTPTAPNMRARIMNNGFQRIAARKQGWTV